MPTVSRFTTAEASAECLVQIRELFFTAFDERFTESDWEHVLGGSHVVISDGGQVVSHAAVVDRTLVVGDQPFRTGYVEGVATHPSRQRLGLGSQVMDEVARLLRSQYEMGALSTSVRGFYEPLGWERWLGPTCVRYGSQLVRTEDEDGGVLVLPFGPSGSVDLAASISCESRVGDDW
jgi:aminoglycoside 2'-N-acetyltransferase I